MQNSSGAFGMEAGTSWYEFCSFHILALGIYLVVWHLVRNWRLHRLVQGYLPAAFSQVACAQHTEDEQWKQALPNATRDISHNPKAPTSSLEETNECEGSDSSATVQKTSWSITEIRQAGVREDMAMGVLKLAELVGASRLEPLSDPLMLWRFYSARDGNLQAAASMYRDALAWRARDCVIQSTMAVHGGGESYHDDGCRVSSVLDGWSWQRSFASPEAAFWERYGFCSRLEALADEFGAPIALWQLAAADMQGIEREKVLDVISRGFISHLEDILQTGRSASCKHRRIVRCRMIVDAHGISASALRYRKTFRKILEAGKANFPEVNATVTIIRAPAIFARIFQVMRPNLTPVMQRKICILGDDFEQGLLEHAGVDLAALPAFLGGQGSTASMCKCNKLPVGSGAQLRKDIQCSVTSMRGAH